VSLKLTAHKQKELTIGDNVDYNDIKQLIKKHTTSASGKAVIIPGQSKDDQHQADDLLYQVLCEQHERINLFVRSKKYEIDRRLGKKSFAPDRASIFI
jgi:hypothetical protein